MVLPIFKFIFFRVNVNKNSVLAAKCDEKEEDVKDPEENATLKKRQKDEDESKVHDEKEPEKKKVSFIAFNLAF